MSVDYSSFIQSKIRGFQKCGFEPSKHVVPMWDWQRELTNWSISISRQHGQA